MESCIVEGWLLCWSLTIDDVSTSGHDGTSVSVSCRRFRFEAVLISLIDIGKIEDKFTCWSDVKICWQN